MKELKEFEKYRIPDIADMFFKKDVMGKFIIPFENGTFEVTASNYMGWDHISIVVITKNGMARIAASEEIERLKKMFFGDEVTIEVHPKKKDYINIDEVMLHVWRPLGKDLPLPPAVNHLEEFDLIKGPKKGIDLMIGSATVDGWDCYEVRVLKNGKKMKRLPSWAEMCVAKKAICGENTVALQYHIDGEQKSPYTIRLWIPPENVKVPLPESYLVGCRNEEERAAFDKKLYEEAGRSLRMITPFGFNIK